MAKISVYPKVNKALVESTYSLANIQKVAKYAPKALCIEDEKTGEQLFSVYLSKGGCIGSIGCGVNANGAKDAPASVELTIPAGTEDAKKFVEEAVGTAILNLNKVEDQIAAALADIDAQLTEVRENITVVE